MLGERICALRRVRGLSQAELARQLKISPSAMGMYEQGRREPSLQTLVLLARELSVSTDFLLTGQAATAGEAEFVGNVLSACVDVTDRRLEARSDRPFSRQELAVLFAALLSD